MSLTNCWIYQSKCDPLTWVEQRFSAELKAAFRGASAAEVLQGLKAQSTTAAMCRPRRRPHPPTAGLRTQADTVPATSRPEPDHRGYQQNVTSPDRRRYRTGICSG